MKQLKSTELAHYAGSPCFFNNGNEVLKGDINFLMLHQYEKETCIQIIPILRPLKDMTTDEMREWSKQPHFVDGFAKDAVNKISTDLFNFHRFVSEWGAHDSYLFLMEKGFDVFGWLDQKKAINKERAEGLNATYSIEAFTDILRMI